MAENVFEAVKQSVSTREAAEFYGIKVSRTGMACCPFHDDKNPSMKLNEEYFYCFGCGATGDVIDFTAKLFDLSPKEAAEKLAQDFGLIYDSQAPPRRRYVRQKTEAQQFREDRQRCYRVLSDYYHLLKKWESDHSPRTPEEKPHPRFVEAIHKKIYVEYLLDLFLYESEEEQKAWIAEHTAEITHLERRLKIMAENKPTNRERLREITDGIEQGIKELFESEKYMRYLSVMSRFHRYSVNNTMLIYMQKPDATLVAGYNKWKDQFERHVKKGEHGITIIAPTPYKKKIEEQKLDPDTKAPILDKDGKIITEEKEIEIPMFRPVKVFDVSQTDGKPLPELASSLSGNVPNYEAFMEALRRSALVPITFEAMAADTDGYFSADHQKIAIRQGMSEVQTVSATVHEIAHSKLHNQKKIQIANDEQYQEIELFDKLGLFSNGRIARDNLPEGVYCYDLRGSDYDPGDPVCVEERVVVNHAGSVLLTEPLELTEDGRLMLTEEKGLNFTGGFSTLSQFLQKQRKDRHTEEVEAESISYAVCKYFGIETGENSFGYIASWSQGKELKELRASLETINKTSGTLISDIERHYKEICKERGIDPHAKVEPETAPIGQPADAIKVSDRLPTGDLTYYVAECMEFPNLGEYHDNLSLEEAIRIHQEIPAERMNGIKGIGFELKDGSDYEGPFPILTGQTIDLDTIQAIDYYRDNPLVQKAVKELAAAMPEMEVLGADANQQEALFLIDNATYLHIQSCDSGWDYTLYDAASMKELDGGQLDMPEISRMKAVLQICDDNDLGRDSVKYAPLSMIETLQEAAYQQMQAEASQMAASSQLPEAQEQALDEYPMPDEQVSTPDMLKYGYSYDGMLPVTRERALELDAAGLTVYVLHEDNTESMVFDPQEIMEHGGLCGVDREEWEKSPQFHEKVMERQEHQQEREQAFLSQNRDCFAIYQVKHTDELRDIRYEGMDWLRSIGQAVKRENYDLVYTAPLEPCNSPQAAVEQLYNQFNNDHPADYHHPSMSVSDIVAIKQDGKVSCHYCDSVGFTEIPGFLPDNPLKNAEMMLEDDYGMIDGIINNGPKEPTVAQLEQQARSGQPISLMDLAEAVHREERDKKKSVMEQLKSQPRTEHKKTAPKKSAEREI
ncbi:LPD28 domain-containing protein [[Clostridium] symbiosum]|uniref:LPD28 domain-containing protein n=1 Tax=Clostridium symbiosum TaxID=1512 RepID=UPI0018995C2D|nr:LPD28 domain-containing protein [[Clostridium] symbiosum]MDB2021965.1 YodL domain-containing protein [[Clostridium] symbiosum]